MAAGERLVVGRSRSAAGRAWPETVMSKPATDPQPVQGDGGVMRDAFYEAVPVDQNDVDNGMD